jgi:hypothetical protein
MTASRYTQQIADKIVARVSDGEPLKTMCREPGMPSWRTVYDWIRDRPEFAAAMERARELGADAIAAECLEIADTPLTGEEITIRGKSKEIRKGDMLGHRKLQIETRLKLLAKWHPKKYGEKVEHTGAGGGPIQHEATVTMTAEEAYKRMLGG